MKRERWDCSRFKRSGSHSVPPNIVIAQKGLAFQTKLVYAMKNSQSRFIHHFNFYR